MPAAPAASDTAIKKRVHLYLFALRSPKLRSVQDFGGGNAGRDCLFSQSKVEGRLKSKKFRMPKLKRVGGEFSNLEGNWTIA